MFSVDLEEFDIPEEHGTRLPLDTKLSVSLEGMRNLQCLMQQHQATATLFTTTASNPGTCNAPGSSCPIFQDRMYKDYACR